MEAEILKLAIKECEEPGVKGDNLGGYETDGLGTFPIFHDIS